MANQDKKKVIVKVKKKIPVDRVRQVADSLSDVGYKKMVSATNIYSRGSEELKKNIIKNGWKDVDNSDRYNALADQAEKKSKNK